ncbi:MAG: membrane-bound lytic murein transglycosylase MltF [Aromatoleum sp.]|nr:membrane-bound lytic murein transglycosylase MltF [Aromatoleum sp.]
MRLSRRVAFAAAGLAVVTVIAFVLRHATQLAPPLRTPAREDELLVLVRPGPAAFFPGLDGEASGLDADLARLFAAELRLPVRFVTASAPTQLLEDIAHGDAHVGAGGLYRPVAAVPSPSTAPSPPDGKPSGAAPGDLATRVLWTTGYYTVEPVLIYNADGFKPGNWKDLAGETVAYIPNTGLDSQIAAVRAAHPEVTWEALDVPSADALIAQVSDGSSGYAVVASNEAAVSRNIYLFYDVAFPIGGRRELAWAVPAGFTRLRDQIDAFFARLKRDGTLARLAERYFTHTRQVQRIDAAVFQERIRSLLPQYRTLFQDAQAATGIEWRLLAAVSYQESQWDPGATSETGVRGLMQLTEDTARHLGVMDRLDPKASILAAARYLQDLKDKMPVRIQEPDRTWLALAAFNIGIGHLEDARILAQKQKLNPDIWSDVKKSLPLLALPEYYELAKSGYARGGMPVVFVDRVRAYYDVMLAQQPASLPRLRLFAGTPAADIAPAKTEPLKK